MQGRPIRAILEMVILPASSFSGYGAYATMGQPAIFGGKSRKIFFGGALPPHPRPLAGAGCMGTVTGPQFCKRQQKSASLFGSITPCATRPAARRGARLLCGKITVSIFTLDYSKIFTHPEPAPRGSRGHS